MSLSSISSLPPLITDDSEEEKVSYVQWLGHRICHIASFVWQFVVDMFKRIFDISVQMEPIIEWPAVAEVVEYESKEQARSPKKVDSPSKKPPSPGMDDSFHEGDLCNV